MLLLRFDCCYHNFYSVNCSACKKAFRIGRIIRHCRWIQQWRFIWLTDIPVFLCFRRICYRKIFAFKGVLQWSCLWMCDPARSAYIRAFNIFAVFWLGSGPNKRPASALLSWVTNPNDLRDRWAVFFGWHIRRCGASTILFEYLRSKTHWWQGCIERD